MDWEEHYRNTPMEKLHWYCEGADPGVMDAVRRFCPSQGRVLDLGTGPGTMAIEFAKTGYTVVATDLSPSAIEMARKNAGTLEGKIEFVVDDILDSALLGPFSFIHDRGCFHVFDPYQRPLYREKVSSLLKEKGILLLKTFSSKEPRDDGPYRYTIEELRSFFAKDFIILHWEESFFVSTLEPNPRALFVVLKKQ